MGGEIIAGSAGERLMQQRAGSVERAERFYRQQVLGALNERMIEFLGRQEMMFLSTADALGHADCTLRAGPPGFVTVLSPGRVAWPEYRGNGVLASVGNLLENPNVGLLFVDFFQDVIGLHVNGHATIASAAEMRREHAHLSVDPVPGRRAERWVNVFVEEAYIHCAKHIPRLRKVTAEDRAWGTDDMRRKGGDFFGSAADLAGTVAR
jgi:predicted pyridoxine 5'-phosphate oxidase superfamily flavin-nucleotide-binding protein